MKQTHSKTLVFGERRATRSSKSDEALALLLAARAKQRGSQTLVVGTIDGLLVAAPKGTEGDLVAAFGACQATGKPVESAQTMSTCAMNHESFPLVVTAVGGSPIRRDELEQDVERILATPED